MTTTAIYPYQNLSNLCGSKGSCLEEFVFKQWIPTIAAIEILDSTGSVSERWRGYNWFCDLVLFSFVLCTYNFPFFKMLPKLQVHTNLFLLSFFALKSPPLTCSKGCLWLMIISKQALLSSLLCWCTNTRRVTGRGELLWSPGFGFTLRLRCVCAKIHKS